MRSSSVSQRSSSAQKTRVKVRSKTPKRDDAARPTWDVSSGSTLVNDAKPACPCCHQFWMCLQDTANDLNKYKLTPEEQVCLDSAMQIVIPGP